jgi:hypothetical protein
MKRVIYVSCFCARFEVLTTVSTKISILRHITQCNLSMSSNVSEGHFASVFKVDCSLPFLCINQTRNFGKRITLRATYFKLISCLASSSTLNVEAKFSFEILVDFQRTAVCYIPDNRTLCDAYVQPILKGSGVLFL